MRQITIAAPPGETAQLAEIAFAVGISEVSVCEKRILEKGGSEKIHDSIEIDVSTPLAKSFMDKITSAPSFSREEFSIAVRQPRALISHEKLNRLIRPWVEPAVDIFEELWQFLQVTYGFVGRILIGGLGLLLNVIAIVIVALATYAATRVKGSALRCFNINSEKAQSGSPSRIGATSSATGGAHE